MWRFLLARAIQSANLIGVTDDIKVVLEGSGAKSNMRVCKFASPRTEVVRSYKGSRAMFSRS